MELIDVLGRDLEVGQVVAYPVNPPKGISLGIGIVEELLPDSVRLIVTRRDGGLYSFVFNRLDRIIIAASSYEG